MNESVVFFYFQYVLVNWIYKSRVALREQINVLRHQVFVVLNSHKSFVFVWSRHSFYWCAVSISICRRARTAQLPFQRQARAVSFSPTNYEECLHRSEWVSEWVTHLHIGVPIKTSFQCFASPLFKHGNVHYYLLSNLIFRTIGKAMTAKEVGKNSSFRVSVRVIWTCGHAAKHICKILNNFLLLNRFLHLCLNESLLLLIFLSHLFPIFGNFRF